MFILLNQDHDDNDNDDDGDHEPLCPQPSLICQTKSLRAMIMSLMICNMPMLIFMITMMISMMMPMMMIQPQHHHTHPQQSWLLERVRRVPQQLD